MGGSEVRSSWSALYTHVYAVVCYYVINAKSKCSWNCLCTILLQILIELNDQIWPGLTENFISTYFNKIVLNSEKQIFLVNPDQIWSHALNNLFAFKISSSVNKSMPTLNLQRILFFLFRLLIKLYYNTEKVNPGQIWSDALPSR